ncbi:MAG: family 10 glycosylhydrolase [Chloroflexota bacterium]|nr:family 10 glycosylhydrolase [Chloroflexota bacterium]
MSKTNQHQDDEYARWQAVGSEASYLQAGEPTRGPSRVSFPPGIHSNSSTEVQPGQPEEFRGLWVTRWDYSTADDIRRMADQASNANFNVLLFQVRGNADAYYNSALEPWAARLTGTLGADPGWDPLAVAIEEAHDRGLELHAWLNGYPAWLGETPPPEADPEPIYHRFNRLYGDNWVMWNRDQEPMPLSKDYLWANPAHWAVNEHIIAVCRDLLTRYYLDGIHLDHARYASWEYSQDPLTLDRVAQNRSVDPGIDHKEFQRQQINGLVAGIHDAIDDLKPGLLLSAAVWPVYQDTWDWWQKGDGFDGFCQDSIGWLNQWLVDAICPMLYLTSITQDDDQFETLVRDFVARANDNPVFPGITATYSDFDRIAKRIDIVRQAGARGQALFAYEHVDKRKYWDAFRKGPFATPAVVLPPYRTRKYVSGRLRIEGLVEEIQEKETALMKN